MRRRIRPTERGFDWARIALELLGLTYIVLATPFALLMTPRSELERAWPYWVAAYALLFGFVIRDVVRTVRSHRSAHRAPDPAERPGRDVLLDRADAGRRTWRGLRSVGFPLVRRTQGGALRNAILRETRAVALEVSRPDVTSAAEAASVAVGLSRTPGLYWSPRSGTNAVVVGDAADCAVVLGEGMLASFSPDELLGVFAALLGRVEHGAVDSVTGRVGSPGFMWPSDRPEPGLILDAYRVSDVQATLALRDPEPIRSALRKTALADPFMPGLTVDQAQLMWTWPSTVGPWIPARAGEVVQAFADVVFSPGRPLGQRVETVRLQALDDSGAAADGPISEGASLRDSLHSVRSKE